MSEKQNRTTPEGAVKYFRNSIANGDLPATVGCFHTDAVYIDRDGQEVKGLDNLEKAMQHLCTWRPKIEGSTYKVTIVNELAIWVDRYKMNAIMPDGTPIEMEGTTACIMKKNDSGNWLWLVDNPFAGELIGNK